MTLLPKDSPVWSQLQDDAAATGVTPLFSGWLRLPSSEIKRRKVFKAWVIRYQRPLIVPFVLYFIACWVPQMLLSGPFLLLSGHKYTHVMPFPFATAFLS